MKNKKTIMFFSALLIVIFHLWVNTFDNASFYSNIEIFIRTICYIGVDMFFFLTAYSIGKGNVKDLKKFLINRFVKIYVLYILFSIIACIYNNWSFQELLLTISGIQLFIKGGGTFLWFIPAVMLVYILLPIYTKYLKKYKILVWIIWLVFTIIVSYFTDYKAIFIFTNRIPVILIGNYLSETNFFDKINNKIYTVMTLLLLIFGVIILYNFNHFKSIYICDIFYLFAIPLTLGLIMLINKIPSGKVIEQISSCTLEMYCFQMLFGFKIANYIYTLVLNPILTNLLVILIIIIISYIIHLIYIKIINVILNKLNYKLI